MRRGNGTARSSRRGIEFTPGPASFQDEACRTSALPCGAANGDFCGSHRVPVVSWPKPTRRDVLPDLWSAAGRAQQGQRVRLARGTAPARHDRDPLLELHLPGRGRAGPGRRGQPRSGRRSVLRTPRSAVEGRAHAAVGDEHRWWLQAHDRRDAVRAVAGQRPRTSRVLSGRRWRAGRTAAAPRHGTGRARARVSRRLPHDQLLVRAHQGIGEHHARRRRYVHGPLRHPGRARTVDAATATATSSSGISAPARRSWSSRAASCTRTPASRCRRCRCR